MIDKIIASSLRQPTLVVIAVVAVIGLGAYKYWNMPVDAFPDISPIMVPVFAEAHGMAPEEVERLITYPIEAVMNGLPGVTQIKSTSAFGMAVIYVYFRENVDIYFARQLVSERLAGAMNDLPEMHDPPTLGPISTGLGQVFLYYLTLAPGTDTGDKDTGHLPARGQRLDREIPAAHGARCHRHPLHRRARIAVSDPDRSQCPAKVRGGPRIRCRVGTGE
jgi:cobalt-zinc-cadmium resistance protein CzcA